jgi:tRNA(adenine34) deaminase
MKKIFILLLILIGFLLFIFLFRSEIYRITTKEELTDVQKKELYNLAVHAKNNGDLPISALLVNNNEIIGKGYNTIVSDSDICGHAEINALKDAMYKTGLNTFMKMDKSGMKIISTLEPCEMCKGVLLHYNIKDVQFIKEKSLFSNLYSNYSESRYQLNKKQISSPVLLDSLSRLHPDY